jgi:tRNA dimethylallyltransferase
LVADGRLLEEALRAIDGAERQPGTRIAVVGPTASGKTELAIEIAERSGGEIVGADSVQVYRGFDVGSGKPTAEERARAPHHMVDVLDPLDAIDAARYAAAADLAVAEIERRGRRPILAGGTFLWVKALLFGLAPAPAADPAIRARHRDEASEPGGSEALHARLQAIDPQLAARLHPRDVLRVSRGLEVHELTGRPLSAWQAEHAFRERGPFLLLAISRSNEDLTLRITRRVDAWLAAGWIEEVERLAGAGYGGARAMGSVGYREVSEHLAGKIARVDLAAAIVRSTRVFARRQRTWLNDPRVRWLGR